MILDEVLIDREAERQKVNKLSSEFSRKVPKGALWKPKYYTKPNLKNITAGPAVALFAKSYITAFRGTKNGEAVDFMEWQRWLTNCVFEMDETGENYRYSNVTICVPRKNGKTFLMAIFLMFHLITAPFGSNIYSAAGSRDQARIIFEAMENWVKLSPELSKVLKVIPSSSKIINLQTNSSYRALAADVGTTQGLGPYAVACDETWTWDGSTDAQAAKAVAFYNGLQSAMSDTTSSQLLSISTSGNDIDNSLLGKLWKRGMAAIESNDKNGNYGFFCWQAEDGDDPEDEATWVKSNPSLAEGVLVASKMKEELEMALYIGLWHFLRDRLNIWSNVSGEPFITPLLWGKTFVPDKDDVFTEKRNVVAGFDASKRGDSTGIVISDLETGQLKMWEVWERPKNAPDDWLIDRDDIEASFKRLHVEHNVSEIWADRYYYESDLKKWKRNYKWKIKEIGQSKERKDRYAAELRQDLLEGKATHGDQEEFNKHIANTVLQRNGESFMKSKKDNKIDLFVCAILANSGRRFVNEQPERKKARVLVRNKQLR